MSDREKRAWSRWQQSAVENITRTPETVAPPVRADRADVFDPAPERHVWDTWPLRNRHGEIATVDGWQVLISLTAPGDVAPGDRHDIAEHRYFVSQDGRNWQDGGPLFDEAPLGTRQWAGSALLDEGELYLYYTAAGDEDTDELTYTQRLAVAHGGRLDSSGERLTVEGPWSHEILLEPDGDWYETEGQSDEMTYTFRDPWFFADPETGDSYLLFESNTPVDSKECGGDRDQQAFNGCVGLAVSPSGDLLDWEFRPPIFDSVCVNQEIERPHLVVRDGQYYLFVSSHVDTFAPGLAGYDGLYGFVADSVGGDYQPLNDSGLVLTNPATAPFQAYSWLVIPCGDELLVEGFVNYPELAVETLEEIAALSDAEQQKRFAGTLTPTLRLEIEGDRTRIVGQFDPWQMPATSESLPVSSEPWEPPADVLEPTPGLTRTESRRTDGPVW